MEKLNLIKDGDGDGGVLRLPPGFRFHPTDEELIGQYLKRKVLCYPLPPTINIPQLDSDDPWNLPGDLEQERYFFSTRAIKYPNGNRSNRATSSGYWKATGLDKKILTCRSNHVIGMKKTLVFYRGKPPNACKTDWIMHEYRLPYVQIPQGKNSIQDNWVLCRIFLKKRKTKSGEIAPSNNSCSQAASVATNRVVFYNFMAKYRTDLNLVPTSSSSGSSGITQVTCHESDADDHEESSACNTSTNPIQEIKPWP